jgi:hypothetical protein
MGAPASAGRTRSTPWSANLELTDEDVAEIEAG